METTAVTPFSPGNDSSVRASIERLANRLSADVQYLSAAYPCLGLRIPCAVGTPMPTATLLLVHIDSLLTSCEVARSSLTDWTAGNQETWTHIHARISRQAIGVQDTATQTPALESVAIGDTSIPSVEGAAAPEPAVPSSPALNTRKMNKRKP